MKQMILLGAIGPTEFLLVILIFLILFGGKKIPELMRGLGEGIREFKKASNVNEPENKDIKKEDK
jgi:sec-independent protein translocase protein TatA